MSADIDARVDRLAGLRRIGIDEISYKRGHRYLTVVVDHDTGALVWAAPGRDEATLRRFFDALGDERAAAITHVSADAADWIATVVAERCPNALRCADAFHVVAWATDALDEVRRQAWNEARGAVDRRRAGRATGHARALKQARYALWKNPENLTDRQRVKLDWIAKSDPRLHRAYLLKEELRMAFVLKGAVGKEALDRWISWARRCRIPAFVQLQRRIVKQRAAMGAAFESGLSNALIESTKTKIRLITRVAFGFYGPEPLITLAMLSLGGHPPAMQAARDPRISQEDRNFPIHQISRRKSLRGQEASAPPAVHASAPPRPSSARPRPFSGWSEREARRATDPTAATDARP